MKKIDIKLHTGECINNAVILGQALLVLLVKVGAKTFLISRESILEDSILPPDNEGNPVTKSLEESKTVDELETSEK